MSAPDLRAWQKAALTAWEENHHRGIVGAVTGGGKTVFALACIRKLGPQTAIVVVPTQALLDQWWEETAAFFSIGLDDVHILSGRERLKPGTVNIGVLNTVAKLAEHAVPKGGVMLVVDECHKAASPTFRRVLDLPTTATLGLSATPERPYDDGLTAVLVPKLGPVLFQYDYSDALRDGVIVPFDLRNVVFDLEEDRQQDYGRLTRSIAQSVDRAGADAPESVALYLRRARLVNLSPRRVELALKLVARHRGSRTLVFHEDIQACEVVGQVLLETGFRAGVYHSKLPVRVRAVMLSQFRRGEIDVLVTCRALDEGFNVPETTIGIIAASTATRRQRIQRLGRILRPSHDKERATVYTLVATDPEIVRLKEEEADLDGVANVTWGRA